MLNKAHRAKGYVLLYRSLVDHPAYFAEPFDRIRAWVDLLILAKYESGHVFIGNFKVNYLRGQVVQTKQWLAKRWQWGVGRVRRYLKQLEDDKDIVCQHNNITTIVTILNYNYYQDYTGEVVKEQNSPGKHPQHNRPVTGGVYVGKSSPAGILKNKKGIHVTVNDTSSGRGVRTKKQAKKQNSDRGDKKNNDSPVVGGRKTSKSSPVRVLKKPVRVGDTVNETADLRVHGRSNGRSNGMSSDTLLNTVNTFKAIKTYNGDLKKIKKTTGGRKKKVAPPPAARRPLKTEHKMVEMWKTAVKDYPASKKFDTKAAVAIKQFIAEQKNINPKDKTKQQLLIDQWQIMMPHILANKFYAGKPLKTIASNIQTFYKKNTKDETDIKSADTGIPVLSGQSATSEDRFNRLRNF